MVVGQLAFAAGAEEAVVEAGRSGFDLDESSITVKNREES